MKKLQFREVNKLGQGHTLSRGVAQVGCKALQCAQTLQSLPVMRWQSAPHRIMASWGAQNNSPHSTDGDTGAKRIWETSTATLPGSGRADTNSLLAYFLWLFHQVDSGEWTSLSSQAFDWTPDLAYSPFVQRDFKNSSRKWYVSITH